MRTILPFFEIVVGESTLSADQYRAVIYPLESVPNLFLHLESHDGKTRFRLLPFNTAAEWSDMIAKHASHPQEAIKAISRTIRSAVEGRNREARDCLPARAMAAKLTTGHLFHGLHVYKAKIFARMVRTLLSLYAPSPSARVLDPFAGRGAALTEASVKGLSSTGVDIDLLSVLIAQAKTNG